MAFLFGGRGGNGPYISYSPITDRPTGYPVTISAWYKTPTTSWTTAEAIAVFTDSADGNSAIGVIISNTGLPSAVIRNSAGNQSASSWATAIFANTWYHIVGVFTSGVSGGRRVYVDGVAGTAGTGSLTVTFSDCNSVQIGRRIAAEARAAGEIAEVGMWNAQLTDAEIVSLYDGLTPVSVRPQNLFFYTPLVRESHELRYNHTRTVSGTPTATSHIRVYQ